MASFFRGLAAGRMGVVAPISALGTTVISVLAGLVGGERPSLVASGGLCFLIATQRGYLAIAGVVVSIYPAVTVLLAVVVLKERVQPVQAGAWCSVRSRWSRWHWGDGADDSAKVLDWPGGFFLEFSNIRLQTFGVVRRGTEAWAR